MTRFFEKLRPLFHSAFLRNIATVSGGQIGAAAIPFLAAPILGRLYSPTDYGFLTIYMGFASVLGAVGNWQYAQGIIVAKREVYALALVRVCFFTSLITALAAIPVTAWILSTLGHRGANLWGWFLILPVSTFIGGISGSLAALANRLGLYKRIAVAQLVPVLASVGVSVVLGFRGVGSSGLFAAYFASQLITIILALHVVHSKVNLTRHVPGRHLKAVFARHRGFALFTMPTAFLGTATLNAPIYALTALNATGVIGSYGRANQLVGMPFSLIGTSISLVFQRRAAVDFANQGNCRGIFLNTMFLLLAVSALPTAILVIYGPELCALFLGPKWFEAGRLAQILAPMFLVRLIVNPLATVFYVAGAQRADFVITTGSCVLTWVLILMTSHFTHSALWVVGAYSAGYTLSYLVFLAYAWKLAKGSAYSIQSRNTTSTNYVVL